MLKGSSHCHLWGHHPGQALYCPVQRGSWGNKINKPHTSPCKVTSRCGSVMVCVTPAREDWHCLSPCAQGAAADGCIRDCYTSPGAALPPWATSPRPLLMPPRPTAISPVTSGKRPCSPSLPLRHFADHLVKTPPEVLRRGPRLRLWPPHNFMQEE